MLVTTPLASRLLQMSLPLVKHARYLVVPSNYFKKITEEHLPDYPPDRIIVSASGGVKSIFKPAENNLRMSECLKIGYVSRIDRGKGWDILLDAIKILNQRNLKTILYIVGGGPQIREMKSIVAHNELTNVDYLGPIAHDKLPNFYRELDVFIFPTLLRESLGLVGLEAMACGVPVIGSKIGGLTDYISDGYNGYFFTAGNFSELAERIYCFSKLTISQRIEMSKNALNTSKEYSDLIVSTKLFDKIL